MKDVIIYTTPVCTYCKKAKEFMSDRGIKYTEINALDNRDLIKEKTGRLIVPVFVIDGEWISGYDEAVFSSKIGL